MRALRAQFGNKLCRERAGLMTGVRRELGQLAALQCRQHDDALHLRAHRVAALIANLQREHEEFSVLQQHLARSRKQQAGTRKLR